MGQPAAKQGDMIQATDIHIVMVPTPGGPVPTPIPGHPFSGILDGNLSSNVNVMGMPVATLGSTANNQPPHIPMGGPSFQIPPTNQATIIVGSGTVFANGKPVARNGDTANTCNDPAPMPVGTVIAVGTVMVGG
ncbi:MAG: PAAR domain-containing protein [Anaerolineae bacterium]|nr:PAAR domain-containing protein [Anaerolineae bacterium]